jgi:hypothetical protein
MIWLTETRDQEPEPEQLQVTVRAGQIEDELYSKLKTGEAVSVYPLQPRKTNDGRVHDDGSMRKLFLQALWPDGGIDEGRRRDALRHDTAAVISAVHQPPTEQPARAAAISAF